MLLIINSSLMKKIKLLLLLVAIFATGNSFAQTQIINISTGIDNTTGDPIGGGPDDTWEILAPHWNTIPYIIYADGYPTETPCGATFVGYNKPAGNFTFRTTFTPYSFPSCNSTNIVSAKIVFTYTNADDQLLNFKVNTGFTHTYSSPQPSFSNTTWTPGLASVSYTVNIPTSAITSGVNNLDFEVYNWTPGTGTTPVSLCLCAQLEITYAGTLTPTFTTPSSICYGAPITATGSVTNDPSITNHVWIICECDALGNVFGPDYWAWAGVGGIPGTYTFPAVMPGGPTIACGKYYKIKLAAMNPCNNWGETTQIVYVNCLPSVNAGADVTICNGSSVTLSAGSGPTKNHTYTWYVGTTSVGSGKTLTVSPTVTTTYCVTATNNTTGCSATDCITVFVDNLDPNFSLSANTTNSSFLTLSATPNQTTGLPAGFGFMWFVDELNSSLATVYAVNSSNAGLGGCWWTFPGAEVFDGFNGLSYTLNSSCLPSLGQFKYNTYYRITRGVWSTNCTWRQSSFLIMYTRSANGVVIVEDPNAPDMSGYATMGTANKEPETNSVTISGLKLYPNPVENVLNAQYKLAENAEGKIQITDLAGRVLKTIVLHEGSVQTQIDMSNLTNGAYLVNFYEAGKLSVTEKIVVTK